MTLFAIIIYPALALFYWTMFNIVCVCVCVWGGGGGGWGGAVGYSRMSEKWGLSNRNQEKIGSFVYFLLKKRRPIIYLAVLKEGAIRHAHPYYAIYTERLILQNVRGCELSVLDSCETQHGKTTPLFMEPSKT